MVTISDALGDVQLPLPLTIDTVPPVLTLLDAADASLLTQRAGDGHRARQPASSDRAGRAAGRVHRPVHGRGRPALGQAQDAAGNLSARRQPAREPGVVAALQPLEHVDEQLEAVALDPARARPGGRADVDPDPEDDPFAGFREDARRLAPVDEHVVRVLDRRRRPDRVGDCLRRDERQLRPVGDRRRRVSATENISAGVDPGPPEPAAALGLVLRQGDRAVRARPAAASAAWSAASSAQLYSRPKLPRSAGTTISGCRARALE